MSRLMHSKLLLCALAALVSFPVATSAQTPPVTVAEEIQVTATRLPSDATEVPAVISVISGEELARRGATDLASALALLGGISIAPGGDGGPAASVPEMMGLKEFDAFLLVVDDVPWGGAFNPALASLDLTGVERIEVLRGSAPVLYGATSFVGVIHVIHRAAGQGDRSTSLWAGSYSSFGASAILPLPTHGGWSQSLIANGEDRGFRDDRTGFTRGHLLYRGRGALAGGTLRLDLDATLLRQDPSSPSPRAGKVLSPLVPLDANNNPRDAHIDENRVHLVGAYERPALGGAWTTTLAATFVSRDIVRGMLSSLASSGINAAGYAQDQDETDLYFDTHLGWKPSPNLDVVVGADVLAGKGEADSKNFDYAVGLDGSNAPSSGSQTILERPSLEDERVFLGLYAQGIWKPAPRWSIEAGARLNHTSEDREGEVEGAGGDEEASDSRTTTRGSGSLGVSFLAWGHDREGICLFADARDAFKPAAIDFGPEAEGEILEPETARTIEGGVKGVGFGGRFRWQASYFDMQFKNLVVASSVDGRPTLVNAGEESFAGWEVEAAWRAFADLTIQASYADHDARFGNYLRDFDGTLTQLDGKRIEMSPQQLAAFGIVWAPERGLNAHASVNRVGDRYLNMRNTALAEPYTLWSAGLGFRFSRAEIRLDGENLGDRRDPVAESELGDAQYYRLPSRTIRGTLTLAF